jgi:hypothetical protein
MHAEASHEILKDIQFPWPIADILAAPRKHGWQRLSARLAGDEILLEARIIHVADSMEAMLSHRPFRRQLGQAQALAQLQQYKGSVYDPPWLTPVWHYLTNMAINCRTIKEKTEHGRP